MENEHHKQIVSGCGGAAVADPNPKTVGSSWLLVSIYKVTSSKEFLLKIENSCAKICTRPP